MTGQNRIRAATGVWFGVLLGGLMSTDAISRLDGKAIAAIVIVSATVMFTCMQVIVREMRPPGKAEVRSVRRFRERPVGQLALRNLGVVSALYGALWLCDVIPF
jgi:hypothetical protein